MVAKFDCGFLMQLCFTCRGHRSASTGRTTSPTPLGSESPRTFQMNRHLWLTYRTRRVGRNTSVEPWNWHTRHHQVPSWNSRCWKYARARAAHSSVRWAPAGSVFLTLREAPKKPHQLPASHKSTRELAVSKRAHATGVRLGQVLFTGAESNERACRGSAGQSPRIKR